MATAEIEKLTERLNRRIDELLDANNREVECRRQAEERARLAERRVEELLSHSQQMRESFDRLWRGRKG